ncbi:MAG: transporter substrate-binding domain-containing protein [Erysipelotrichaceae bacterium]|nr:transporter substrate-binding domain-containing protein [Erysipelotrichaceae bacterium]
MKKIIKLLTVMVILTALFGCSAKSTEEESLLDKIKAAGVLKVAVSPDFAPMEFIDASQADQAQYVGFDIALAQYIADELGVELYIDAMDFSSCQAAVSTGTVDISISGYAYTDERAENYTLSDPYYADDSDEQGILILAANADSLKTAEDFAGKSISAQNASLQWNLLTEQLPDAEANPIVDLNTAVLELINGKVDGLCVAVTNGESFIQNYPQLALSDYKFDVESDGNVILMPKGEDELAAEINTILAKAQAAGNYETWYTDAVELAKSLGQISE